MFVFVFLVFFFIIIPRLWTSFPPDILHRFSIAFCTSSGNVFQFGWRIGKSFFFFFLIFVLVFSMDDLNNKRKPRNSYCRFPTFFPRFISPVKTTTKIGEKKMAPSKRLQERFARNVKYFGVNEIFPTETYVFVVFYRYIAYKVGERLQIISKKK